MLFPRAAVPISDASDPRLALYLPKHQRHRGAYEHAVWRLMSQAKEVGQLYLDAKRLEIEPDGPQKPAFRPRNQSKSMSFRMEP